MGGDNDPIDVLQINDTPCETGDVMSVRVLGTLALVDGGETDWKLIVVQNGDPKTDSMMDIDDVRTRSTPFGTIVLPCFLVDVCYAACTYAGARREGL